MATLVPFDSNCGSTSLFSKYLHIVRNLNALQFIKKMASLHALEISSFQPGFNSPSIFYIEIKMTKLVSGWVEGEKIRGATISFTPRPAIPRQAK